MLYEMTGEELEELREACKLVPYMVVGGVEPEDPVDKAFKVWKKLAKKYNFKWDTARPAPDKGERYFVADAL